MVALTVHAADLDAAWKLVQQRWEAASEVWTDAVHEEFAANHWQPLEEQTQAVQRSLERLAQAVAQAQRVVK